MGYASDDVEITRNALNGNLVDASVVVTIDQSDIVPHDIMTCEVIIDGTDFVKRFEKTILEKTLSETSTEEVYLVEELCDSANCFKKLNKAGEENDPVDYEAVEDTIDMGTGVDTMSEEAAALMTSSSSSFCVNIILVWVISSATLWHSW